MKILVPVKRVPDYEAKITVKADGSGIESGNLKWIMNPFEEIAVEEAVRLKEARAKAGQNTEVLICSIGGAACSEQIRKGLAIGADRGVLVEYDGIIDSDLAARVLAELCRREAPDLVLVGKQAIDSDAAQTPSNLARRLKWPLASFASKLPLVEGAATFHVTREVDGGLETVELELPAVISTDLRLNTPRYVALPGIMAAKKKPLDSLPIAQLGIDLGLKSEMVRLHPPIKRVGGRRVKSVTELVSALKSEFGVL